MIRGIVFDVAAATYLIYIIRNRNHGYLVSIILSIAVTYVVLYDVINFIKPINLIPFEVIYVLSFSVISIFLLIDMINDLKNLVIKRSK